MSTCLLSVRLDDPVLQKEKVNRPTLAEIHLVCVPEVLLTSNLVVVRYNLQETTNV